MTKKKKKTDLSLDILDDTMDDTFAFIAGHTSWGFPYGTTWEEVGINPSLPFEEKKRLYETGEYPSPAFPGEANATAAATEKDKRRVQRMYAEGDSPEKIASIMELSVELVKEWLAAPTMA